MKAFVRAAWRLLLPTGLGLGTALSGCTPSLPRHALPEPGTYRQITPLRYHLVARTYRVHVPRHYSEQRLWPLVLVLHGAFSNAATIEEWSRFSQLADREGFVVAYPNGIGWFGFLQHWNAGHCCGLAAEDHVDDVSFLRYVIGDVSSRLQIDPRRVYIVGHSNGGMLAYYFGATDSEQIAGIGVMGGALGSEQNSHRPLRMIGPPQRPVPLIALHGRDDPTVPFEGGTGRRTVGGRRYISVLDSTEGWAAYCGCGSPPQVRNSPEGDHYVLSWRDTTGKPWVILHVLDHWGHQWPRAKRNPPSGNDDPESLGSGRKSRGQTVDGAQIIWDFLREQTCPADPCQP